MLGLPRKWWVLIGVGLFGIMVAVDFTIVNTVLPNIQRTFSVNMDSLQWVMTGFGITFSSFLISMGKLGDLIGRRRLLYFGAFGFAVASLIAGFSGTIHHLIIARILQGAFGAILFPCGMAITSNTFEAEEQGRALGIYGSLLGIGLAIGPVLGGFISSISNWRWIFFINLPIIVIGYIICIAVVPESRSKNKVEIDWIGMFLITGALSAFVFAITQSQAYSWHSPVILITLVSALILFMLFFIAEKYSHAPLLPPNLFLNHAFFISVMIYCICVGLTWTIIFFIPLYLQNIFGLSNMQTGLCMLPMTAMTVIAPIISGAMFDREGPFTTTLFAFGMMILGLVLLLFFSRIISMQLILVSFVAIGLSWGTGNGIALPLALSNPENKEHEGLISGASITALNVFGVLVLSIASTLFHYIQQLHKNILLQHAFISAFHIVIVFLLLITLSAFAAVLYSFMKIAKEKY